MALSQFDIKVNCQPKYQQLQMTPKIARSGALIRTALLLLVLLLPSHSVCEKIISLEVRNTFNESDTVYSSVSSALASLWRRKYTVNLSVGSPPQSFALGLDTASSVLISLHSTPVVDQPSRCVLRPVQRDAIQCESVGHVAEKQNRNPHGTRLSPARNDVVGARTSLDRSVRRPDHTPRRADIGSGKHAVPFGPRAGAGCILILSAK